MLQNKEIADYLGRIVKEFEGDRDLIRLLRRLRIKEVHLIRRNNHFRR